MKKISYLIELTILFAFFWVGNFVGISLTDFFMLFFFVILSHVFRIVRLYLVFLDYKLPLSDFVLTYTRGTVFSIITPFKLGEIYKWKLFSNMIGDNIKSLILIVIDRFFDTIILSLILVPYVIMGSHSIISTLSILVVMSLLIFFVIFDESYKYLNNFLMFNSKTDRGVRALLVLERLKDNYDYINNVITGKKILMLVTSLLAWSFEVMAFMVFCSKTGNDFSYSVFVENINTSFSLIVKNDYLIYCAICLVILYIIVLGRKIYEKNSSSIR